MATFGKLCRHSVSRTKERKVREMERMCFANLHKALIENEIRSVVLPYIQYILLRYTNRTIELLDNAHIHEDTLCL